MASDIWKGNGNWTTNLSDWTLNLAPGSTEDAIIESGDDTLTTTGTADVLTIASLANLLLDGAAKLTTTGELNDQGSLSIDSAGGQGGAVVTIGGALEVDGTFTIGNSSLDGATKVTAKSLTGSGTVTLWGDEKLTTSDQATLDFTGAAPTTLTTSIYLHGDALLEFASGGIKTIGDGVEFQLDGKLSRASVGAGATNSALSGLATNYGAIDFEGDWSTGPGGATVDTTVALQNYGDLALDVYGADGASTFSIGGVLTNYNTVSIGNTSLSAKSTVIAKGLTNYGGIVVQGAATGSGAEAELEITAAAPTNWTGTIRVSGNALLDFASGGITSIGLGAWFELDGAQASAAIGTGAANSALAKLATNLGTLDLRGDSGLGAGGVTLKIGTAFTNYGAVDVDGIYGGDGGSTLVIAGALTNQGTMNIGTSALGAAAIVVATSLANTGDLYIDGNGGSTVKAEVKITDAAAAVAEGTTRVGNGLLDFGTGVGITSIGAGAWFELDGSGANVEIGTTGANTGLAKLASNYGTLDLRGDSGYAAGGVSLKIDTAFTNYGTVDVDGIYGGDGASTLAITGALTNQGAMYIGTSALGASTVVTATSLANTGGLFIDGNGGSTVKAEVKITDAAAAVAEGTTRVGNGLLDFGTGVGITSIGAGAWFELDGSGANVEIGTTGANTGLAKLASNYGTLDLRGDSGYGAGGVLLKIDTAFTNYAAVYVDGVYGGDGGSTLAITGALTNMGTLDIGTDELGAATTVSATSLVNTGTLFLDGNTGGSQATLDIADAAAAVAEGTTRVGNAVLDFGTGVGVTSVGEGAWFELDGSGADVEIGTKGANSALAELASNYGTLDLRGDSNYGAGGVSLKIDTAFTNYATVYVDGVYGGDGGSTLAITGALTNKGTIDIGTTGLGAATTVSATSLANTGTLFLDGATSGSQATLDITDAAAAVAEGTTRVGNAVLDFGTGVGITSIGAGAWFELDGSGADVEIGTKGANSALAELATSYGILDLRGDNNYGAGGVSLKIAHAFTNYGTLYVDGIYGGDGGSNLAIAGLLTNFGTIDIGTSGLGNATSVSATGLDNAMGTLNITGSSNAADLTLSGDAANSATVNVNGGATLAITPAGDSYSQSSGTTNINGGGTLSASLYTQSGGTTNVAGTLAAKVTETGGFMDFTSAVTSQTPTGTISISNGAVLEFAQGVDSSHAVDFTDSTTKLELATPAGFLGDIVGFADGDIIDLLNTPATKLTYASNTLDVFNGSTEVAALHFTGSYTQSSFNLVSDNHGGSAILL